MTLGSWVLYVVLVLLAAAFVLWLYLRREPPGRGRPVLAALRLLAFALVLLLLFDPALRLPGAGRPASRVQLLLDASASMNLPLSVADSATTRWQAAVRAAREHGGAVTLFGARPRPAGAAALPPSAPGDGRSLLLPALQAAAEAGAERVVVFTDAALEDAANLPAWLARLGLGIEWRRVGEPLPGVSIREVTAPGWAAAGEPMTVEAVLAAAGPLPDSVRLVVRQDGRPIGQAAAAPPAAGRSVAVRIPVRPTGPAEGGFVFLEVALDRGDVIPADDRRVLSVFVSAEPAGVVLVSLQPDWEPRFLLPVLGTALGVPARGFLRTGADGWVRAGEGQAAGVRVSEGEVARAVAGADLLVAHGVGEGAPPWLGAALGRAARLLVLPGAATAGLPLPLELAAPLADDWFVAAELPPSPVAALLADAVSADAPPLASVRGAVLPEGAWAPLQARRGRAGQTAPVLVAGEGGARRWAVALGEGYWRWAFRGGDSRQLYDRLWAAVGGWLLRDGGGRGAGVRPVARVVANGAPSRWLVPGARADSLRLRLEGGAGVAVDTVLRPALADTLSAPVLPPGRYHYRATAYSGSATIGGSGEVEVETFTPELAHEAVAVADMAPAARAGPAPGRTGGRALHTFALPYLLIVLLLAAEWILRRRWGLR